MACSSPRRIFRNLTAVQLQTLIDNALDRIANGDRTSVSGGGKSGSKNWAMSPEDILFEANAELAIINGTAKPSRTYFDVHSRA